MKLDLWTINSFISLCEVYDKGLNGLANIMGNYMAGAHGPGGKEGPLFSNGVQEPQPRRVSLTTSSMPLVDLDADDLSPTPGTAVTLKPIALSTCRMPDGLGHGSGALPMPNGPPLANVQENSGIK